MNMDRRTFLQVAAVAGGGLMLGITPGCSDPAVVRMRELAQKTGEFAPNAFLTITPDDRILMAMNKAEMGQGVHTGTAVLLAEELEVSVDAVETFHLTSAEFGAQGTGGSTSTRDNYVPVRRAGAAAREMLISAAAAEWGAERSDCRAEMGAVVHKDGRTLTYGKLTKAAALLDVPDDPPLKAPADFRLIGKRTTRVDARDKVTGKAVYGADFSVPNMVRARVIHPPKLGGSVETLDADEARKMPGIVDIFEFERGVAVVAEKYWQACAAVAHVAVTWKDGPHSGLDSESIRKEAVSRLDHEPTKSMRDDGDVEAAFAADGVKIIEAVYEVPYLAHAAMEPMNCTVWVQPGNVQVWAPNQSPAAMAEGVSAALDVDRDTVHVETTMMGGGFGRRAVSDFASEAALIARRVDRPVQLIWTREDDMRAGYFRPLSAGKMRGAVTEDGKVTALSFHGVGQSVMAAQGAFLQAMIPSWLGKRGRGLIADAGVGLITSGTVGDPTATEGISDSAYAIENMSVAFTAIDPAVPIAFWRSVGHSITGFIHETFIDELADAAGTDPAEFRRSLLKDAPRHLGVLEEVVKLSGWGTPIEDGWGRGIAVHKSFGSYAAQVAEAGIVDGRIKVRKVCCAIDCGVVINPDVVKAQMEGGIIFGLSAALDQAIDIVDGEVQQGNYDTFPTVRMFESPDIEVSIVASTEDPTGVGEPGTPPIPAAVSNAIFAATGVRLRRLPMQTAWNEREAQS